MITKNNEVMNIEINICCEDERELLVHLSVIRRNIKREIKRQKGGLLVPATLKDSNCYGDHTVNIKPNLEVIGHICQNPESLK